MNTTTVILIILAGGFFWWYTQRGKNGEQDGVPPTQTRWQAGDQLMVLISGRWEPVTVVKVGINPANRILSYYLGTGHAPNIISYDWSVASRFDTIYSAYKVN